MGWGKKELKATSWSFLFACLWLSMTIFLSERMRMSFDNKDLGLLIGFAICLGGGLWGGNLTFKLWDILLWREEDRR